MNFFRKLFNISRIENKKSKNDFYDTTDYNYANNYFHREKEDKLVRLEEPYTLAKARLEGEAKDKGYIDGIKLYNNHKTKIQNQWINPLISLNSGWSNQIYSFYNYQTINYWECMILSQDPLISKVINTLSQEPLAKGGELISNNLTKEEITEINKILNKYDERKTLEQCLNKTFCMGGCLLYMDFGLENDLKRPLDLKNISMKRFIGFKIIEPINCCAVNVNTNNPSAEDYMKPENWYVVGLGVCHRSHFLQFQFNEPPFMLKPLCLYFGYPITQLIKQDVANSNMVSQGIAELIGRYRYIFLKTPRENFTTNSVKNFRDRLDLMGLLKDNYQIDAITTEEELIQITTPLNGLAENQSFFYQLIAAKTDIPYTKLMGKSADGMNATGEGDRINWYDKIRMIQASIKENKLIIDGILAGIRDGKFVEFEDFIFNPLEELDRKEQVNVAKANVEIAQALVDLGISNEDVLEWLKTKKELQLGSNIKIDTETDNLEDYEALQNN